MWTTPRLLRIEDDGSAVPIATGRRNGPWNGVAYEDGVFYIAEGDHLEGGAILALSAEGELKPILSDLLSLGDHHTNGPVVGPDGWIYLAREPRPMRAWSARTALSSAG